MIFRVERMFDFYYRYNDRLSENIKYHAYNENIIKSIGNVNVVNYKWIHHMSEENIIM